MSKYNQPIDILSVNNTYSTSHGVVVTIVGFAKECGVFIGVSDTYSSPRMYHADGTSVTPQHSNLVCRQSRYPELSRGDIIEAIATENARATLRVYKGDGEMYAAGAQFDDNATTVSLSSQLSWKKVGTYIAD